MTADDRVLVFGEDVAELGGVFRVTDGLAARSARTAASTPRSPRPRSSAPRSAWPCTATGPWSRCSSTPSPTRPSKQLVRPPGEDAQPHPRRAADASGHPDPYGGGIGGVEHHSDSSEAYVAHTPGIHVLTPGDRGRRVLAAAQRDRLPGPGGLLRAEAAVLVEAELALPVTTGPIGTAVIRRPGRDATLIAYGQSVPIALETAEHAREYGYDLEVVDLRGLVPFDDATVAASVERTGRAIVVHEAAGFAGFGAEIAALISERCFYRLEAPVLRVTGLDIPYPPPNWSTGHLPSVDRVLDAVERAMSA